MKGKKSFTAYCDWIETFEALDDEQAGQLVKHIFRYVNDQDPEPPNGLINAVFASIKATLKRDLKKWITKAEKNRQNAFKRWDKDNPNESETMRTHPNASEHMRSGANNAVRDSDSVSVRDSVRDKEVYKKAPFGFRKSLIEAGANENLASDWLKVRTRKKAANTETALKGFLKQVEKSGLSINEVLTECIERSWSGFKSEWIEKEKSSAKKEKELTPLEQLRALNKALDNGQITFSDE